MYHVRVLVDSIFVKKVIILKLIFTFNIVPIKNSSKLKKFFLGRNWQVDPKIYLEDIWNTNKFGWLSLSDFNTYHKAT